jgi:hypothetical protein
MTKGRSDSPHGILDSKRAGNEALRYRGALRCFGEIRLRNRERRAVDAESTDDSMYFMLFENLD